MLITSGFKNWLLQRISAVILTVYILFLAGFCFTQPVITYAVWHKLFSCELMKFATLFMLLALGIHSWLGIWTVTTDYLKSASIRLCVQTAVYIVLLFYLVWGVQILWG